MKPAGISCPEVCPSISQIEFDLDPRFGPPAGDGVVTSTSLRRSPGAVYTSNFERAPSGLSRVLLELSAHTREGTGREHHVVVVAVLDAVLGRLCARSPGT